MCVLLERLTQAFPRPPQACIDGMAGKARLCCQFLSTGELKITLINQVAVKLRQSRQGQAQFFAPLTLFQQGFHAGVRVWRKHDTILIFMPSPSRYPPANPTSLRCTPLAALIRRLQIMGLTSTQLTTPIQGNVFRPHSYPGSKRSPLGIEGVDLLPDSNKKIVYTLFGVLRNSNTIQHQTNKVIDLTRVPGDERFQSVGVTLLQPLCQVFIRPVQSHHDSSLQTTWACPSSEITLLATCPACSISKYSYPWTKGTETYLIGGALALVLKDIRSLEQKSHHLQHPSVR